MSDLATKQYVIDMIGRYVGQFSGGGGTVPDDPAGIIKTCKDYTDEKIIAANTYAETVAGNAREDAETAAKNYTDAEIAECNSYAEQQAVQARTDATTAAKNYTDAEIDAANDYAEQQAETAMNTAEGAAKDYTDEQIILAKQYADGVAATTRTEAETAAKIYTDAEIAECNSYAEQQATQARTDATAAAKNYTDDEIAAAKNYTDEEIAAANDYAEQQAAAAMNEANNTILSYVRARITELDYEFRDVAITNAWQGIYYADVDRPAVLANKHIISTMIVQTYGGSPMGVYLKSPADTSQIRFTSPVSKTMHITVRFVLLNRDDGETT